MTADERRPDGGGTRSAVGETSSSLETLAPASHEVPQRPWSGRPDDAFERVTDALEAHGRIIKPNGASKAMAQCPAHDDHTPSLSIAATEGQALIYCHAGCQAVDVIAALGMKMADLFDDPKGPTYHYDNGRAVHRTPAKQFRQAHTDKPPELYRLAKVGTAVAEGKPVFVVEGEKDVHALESAGVVATTSPMGAKGWAKVDPSPLYGGKILIIADQDEEGRRYARDVYASLRGKADVAIFAPKVGKDAADHVAAGFGVGEFVPSTATDSATRDPFASAVSFAELDSMTFPAPSYLVPHLLVAGGVVLLAGAPKIGKSHLALGIGLAVAQGGKALGALQVSHAGRVLFISLDDTSAGRAQLRARTINIGKPLPDTMTLHTEHTLGRGEQARDNLARYLRTRGKGTVLVVIDTLSHLREDRGHTEGVYDADVRFMTLIRTLQPDNAETTFLGLAHVRKQSADDAVQAVSGTYGITGGADSVLVLTGNRHAPGRAVEVINRDDEGGEYALRFTDRGLIFTDEDPHDPALFMSADDALVYHALRECQGPATAVDIGQMLPQVAKVGDRLARLVHHGAARRIRRGTYEAL